MTAYFRTSTCLVGSNLPLVATDTAHPAPDLQDVVQLVVLAPLVLFDVIGHAGRHDLCGLSCEEPNHLLPWRTLTHSLGKFALCSGVLGWRGDGMLCNPMGYMHLHTPSCHT